MTDLLTVRNALVTLRNQVRSGGLERMKPTARATAVARILDRCVEMADVTAEMQRALLAAEAETKRVRALLAKANSTPVEAAGDAPRM